MNPQNKGRGWKHCRLEWLCGRLNNERKELLKELADYWGKGQMGALDECADVANFAMMIFDNLSTEQALGKDKVNKCVMKQKE